MKKIIAATTIVLASTAVAVGGVDAKNGGANNTGPYDAPAERCDREPETDECESNNGNGKGKAVGKPGAGSVGNADDKNPPGQLKKFGGFDDVDGRQIADDGNAGYECDSNNGVGKGNPAHSPCAVIIRD